MASSERRPVQAAVSYTLSGSPDGTATFHVDDNLDLYLNGVLIYTENVPPGMPGTRNPISIDANVGDTLRFVVRDTYGICSMLSTVFLTDATGNSTVADPGFDLGCGRPAGDQGVTHDYTFVIPDLAVRPGAEFVADIRPGASSSDPRNMRVFQNALYFAANDGVNGVELWRLDTADTAIMVADIEPGSGSSSPSQLTVVGNALYFTAFTAATGVELWKYDGIGPPALAVDVNPGAASGDLQFLTAFGNQLVFRATDGVIGEELFVYDGAALTPHNLYPDSAPCAPFCDSDPYSLTVYNGILYFTAFHPVAGFELWQFDGTLPTLLVRVFRPRPSASERTASPPCTAATQTTAQAPRHGSTRSSIARRPRRQSVRR